MGQRLSDWAFNRPELCLDVFKVLDRLIVRTLSAHAQTAGVIQAEIEKKQANGEATIQ